MSHSTPAEYPVQPCFAEGQAKVICILGMHRSGTSLVARLLNLCGVELGPEKNLLPPAKDNPAGFWEHEDFHKINDEILRYFGGRWDNPPQLTPGWEKAVEFGHLYERARYMIEQNFAQSPCWGWKDPRNSLTIPFWRRLLPEMTFVVCLRHPLDVHRSLRRRDWFSRGRVTRLWTVYTVAALRHTENCRRIITHYESYFDNWGAELSRLTRFLELPDSRSEQTEKQIRSFIDPCLWHHRSSLKELLEGRGIDPLCRALYTALREPRAAAEPIGAPTTEERLSASVRKVTALLASYETRSWQWLDRCREARLFLGKTLRPAYTRIRSVFSL